MKFGTVTLCDVTKKLVEKKIQNYSYSDDDATNYVNFFKNYAKNWLKYIIHHNEKLKQLAYSHPVACVRNSAICKIWRVFLLRVF